MSKNKNNLVPGTIKGIQIVDLEKKIHNKSSSKHYSIKLNKSKNSNYSNNSINNDFSMFSPKDNMSSKNVTIYSKTKQLKNNNKSIRIKGQIMIKNHKGNIIKIKSISTQKKKNINHYNVGSSNNNNVSNVINGNNQSIKGSGNGNKYKIIKKIKNNIKNYKNNINDNTRILNLKKNVKIKAYNLLNETNNINNSNPQMTFIKKSISNQTYLESVSTKSNYNNIDVNKINNNSKILTSNNSCEDLSFNKIVSIQKVKINPKNNNNNNKINEENLASNKNHKRKKIEPYYNNKNSSTSNINKSFNIGKNTFYYNNNIISINSNNNNSNNNNNSVINNNNDLEKTKRTKKIISISCSLKNQKDGKAKMKIHRRQQSMIDQSYNNKNKKNFYQNLSNVSIKSKIKPQTVNIDLQNDSKNKNKIRNSAKKYHNKEEPMSAKKIIEKYRNYLKEYEIEELKQLSKNGELVYYLGEILKRINNKENTFSKNNKSFILKNKNNNTNATLKLSKIAKGEERGFINKSCNNFREGKDEKLNEIKNKFEQNNFNDEEGDYKLNIGAHLNYRYEIIECVGKGSFGEAIKCYDHKNKDLVCVKIINSQQKFQNQAKIEIKILSAISSNDINNDSNNVKFYNYFVFREHICLVFELLGKNLYEYLQINNFVGLDLSLIKTYTIQILFSLLFLRNINIIHCDLKPENILIFPSNPNQIKVID